jgi:hypothetical protein
MDTRDTDLALIAANQDGHFTRRQAVCVGITDKMLRHRLRSGQWVQVQRGIYRSAGVPARVTGEAAVAALCLPGGVVSHHSAGRVHGFTHLGVRPITVTVPRGTTHDLAGIVVHESTDLVAGDCIERAGVRYTSAVRTLIDLAAHLRPDILKMVASDGIRDGLIVVSEAADRLEGLARRGKPGISAMRGVLESFGEGYVPPDSVFESKVLDLLDSAGFPPPERQAALPWRPGRPQRVDLLYRSARLIIECDGRRWHTRERDFERDRRRDNEALLAGWRIFRITWDELVHHPQRIIRDLGLLLDLGSAA